MAERKKTIEGMARDAKAGAVVVLDGGGPVYIEGLDSWPPDIEGKMVKATGFLKRKKLIPDPVVDADGAISQGAEGEQTVLEGANWKTV